MDADALLSPRRRRAWARAAVLLSAGRAKEAKDTLRYIVDIDDHVLYRPVGTICAVTLQVTDLMPENWLLTLPLEGMYAGVCILHPLTAEAVQNSGSAELFMGLLVQMRKDLDAHLTPLDTERALEAGLQDMLFQAEQP